MSTSNWAGTTLPRAGVQQGRSTAQLEQAFPLRFLSLTHTDTLIHGCAGGTNRTETADEIAAQLAEVKAAHAPCVEDSQQSVPSESQELDVAPVTSSDPAPAAAVTRTVVLSESEHDSDSSASILESQAPPLRGRSHGDRAPSSLSLVGHKRHPAAAAPSRLTSSKRLRRPPSAGEESRTQRRLPLQLQQPQPHRSQPAARSNRSEEVDMLYDGDMAAVWYRRRGRY